MSAPYDLPAPRRIIASNLPLPASAASDPHAEPGVEVRADTLIPEPIMGGMYHRSSIATDKQVPTSNDGSGELHLDQIPGAGIVLPGGINTYYIDIAPNSEGPMHRTTSTDYLVVLKGDLSLITPGSAPYSVIDGKSTIKQPVETICSPGDVVLQRGMMHAWVRVLVIVASSNPNRVRIENEQIVENNEKNAEQEKQSRYSFLKDTWLS